MSAPLLCNVCLDCLGDRRETKVRKENYRSYDHHHQLQSLQDSAKEKCSICCMLHQEWTTLIQGRPDLCDELKGMVPFSHISLYWAPPADLSWLTLPVTAVTVTLPGDKSLVDRQYKVQPKESKHTRRFMAALPNYIDLHLDIRRFHPVSKAACWTGSLETWTNVVKWLDNCTSSHRNCEVDGGRCFYPTRLIDIGACSSSAIRLVVTSEIRPRGGYLTLSHRWSQFMPIKLKKQQHSMLCRNKFPLKAYV